MKWNKSAMNRVQPQVQVGHERLWKKDWCSLGARSAYWSGSPWRAVSMMFRP